MAPSKSALPQPQPRRGPSTTLSSASAPKKRPRGRPPGSKTNGTALAVKSLHLPEASRNTTPSRPLKGGFRTPSSREGSHEPDSAPRLQRKSSRLTMVNVPLLQSSPIIVEKNLDEEDLVHGIIHRNGETVFVEPKLADPEPSYTGLPLESFPNAKNRKDAYWPAKTGSGRLKKNGPGLRASSEPETEDDSGLVELAYVQKLEKGSSSQESDIRLPVTPNAPKKLKQQKLKLTLRTPKQQKRPVAPNSGPRLAGRHSKRVKVISPKKPAKNLLAPSSAPQNNTNDGSDDATGDNDDFCNTCGGLGVFICCDTCPKSFHFTCCEPPLEDCPEDNWHCRECSSSQQSRPPPLWNHIGLFGQLLNGHEARNPKDFMLPKKLRENTFSDVSTNNDGFYEDTLLKPELSYTKANGAQIPGFNKNHDLEVDSLYDGRGNPYMCHKCGLSGLGGRTLVHCDYCPLVWHLDCLQEDLYVPKTLGSRWKCPNHVDHLLPQGLFARRTFKDATVADVALHSYFLKIASMNRFVIQHQSQPYFKDNARAPLLLEYLLYEKEDFVRENPDFDKDRFLGNNNPNDIEDMHPSFRVPEYLQSVSEKDRIVARAGPRLSKVLTITNPGSDNEKPNSFVYRVPERLILLSFLAKGRESVFEEVSVKKEAILGDLSEYEGRKRLENDRDGQVVVESLLQIQQNRPATLNFQELVKVATKKGSASRKRRRKKELSLKEIAELLQVKKLMEIKGRESMMEFLEG